MQSLERAFAGVANLLFVSSNTFNNDLRSRQHKNVINAAARVGVGHVSWSDFLTASHTDDLRGVV